MGHGGLGSLPPLRFGLGVCRSTKPRQTQPMARASSSESVSTSGAQKRQLVGKASATGETKRRRIVQQSRREQLGEGQIAGSRFDPKVSEAEHFASCRCKGFCIRCDLFRNRKDYDACANMVNKQYTELAKYRRGQGCMGHGLQAMCSIRSHWRAHGFPMLQMGQAPGAPTITVPCARAASATC